MHHDLGQMGEVARGAAGQFWVDVVGVDPAGRPDELREQGGVVTGTRADVEDRVALLRGERVETAGVQTGFADVDAARWVERDEGVLVEESRIVVGSLDVVCLASRPGRPPECEHRPRLWPGEGL